MVRKKVPLKPLICPNADGSGFVPVAASSCSRELLGCSVDKCAVDVPGKDKSVVAERAVVPDGCAEVVTLRIRSDDAVPSNEARLPAGIMKELCITSGSLIQLAATNSVLAFVEAFYCSSCPPRCVVVSSEMAAALSETVSVSLMNRKACIQPLSLVAVEVTLGLQAETRSGSASKLTSTQLFQVVSAFRLAYKRRLIFTGMRATLRIATVPFYVEVVKCTAAHVVEDNQQLEENASDEVAYGILMDGTRIKQGHCLSAVAQDGPSSPPDNSWDRPFEEHLLVVGEPGTGKSFFLQEKMRDAVSAKGHHVEVISVELLPQGEMSSVSTSTVLREAFARAKDFAPAAIFIDDLHLLCGNGDVACITSPWANVLVAATLCEELDDIRQQQLSVRVFASAPSTDAVHRSLLTHERFGKRTTLTPFNLVEERYNFLKELVESRSTSTHISDTVLTYIAERTNGFTQRDLVRLLDVAAVESFRATGKACVSDTSLISAIRFVRPSVLKQFDVCIPRVTWNDIGGSEAAKKMLQDCVSWCLGKQKYLFEKLRLSPPKGVLLYGPPGCSKTMLAKALANESKMNFISIKGPEVFSKWVGDSEKAVRTIFTRARAAAPCVVFIDELDGMCGHRGRGGVSDRVISQFLTELDGVPAAFSEGAEKLVFVAATNRPDNIDAAVLRPGRFDRKVYVGLPDHMERRAIADIHIRQVPVAPDLDAEYIACLTEGYSGAEVVAVIKEAAFLCVTADVAATHMSRSDIDAALQKVKPRINPRDVEWYKQWFTGNR
ncbi:putative ATPase family protein [Trypanosoma vivax]|nr:putative ATPase family protein [Trypanosoma vivax]